MRVLQTYSICLLMLFMCCNADAFEPFVPTGIPAKLNLEIQTSQGAISEVRKVLETFADSEDLTVDEFGSKMPPKQRAFIFYLTLRKADKVELIVTGDPSGEQFSIGAYNPGFDSDFPGLVSRLAASLEQKWKVRRRQS